MKKIFRILLLIIAVLLIVFFALYFSTNKGDKKLKPREVIYQGMVNLHILKPCYKPMVNFDIPFKQEGFDYLLEDSKITQKSLKILSDTNFSEGIKNSNRGSIPKITHHLYITGKDSVKPINDFYSETIKISLNKLNNHSGNWQHNLWTNNLNVFPEELKKIKGVQVRNISELKDSELYSDVNGDIVKAANSPRSSAYYSKVSDMLRLMVLQKMGGIYSDMDYEIYNPLVLNNLIESFDFIGGRESTNKYSYYGSAFMASKPNHPIINNAIERMKRNIHSVDLPEYLKYPCNFYDEVFFSAPILVTMAYFSENNIDNNKDIILPGWMLFNVDFARYKNKQCDYKNILKETFVKNNENLASLLKEYSSNISADEKDNIYYSLKNRANYKVVGADMFCGNWHDYPTSRRYYWSFLNQ